MGSPSVCSHQTGLAMAAGPNRVATNNELRTDSDQGNPTF